jgi:hypothetical protein
LLMDWARAAPTLERRHEGVRVGFLSHIERDHSA